MMRSWPLDSFRNQPPKVNVRRGNPWNAMVGKVCQDCRADATLWVEIRNNDPKPPQHNFAWHFDQNYLVEYKKLCEGCFALRVLGEGCVSQTVASDAHSTTTGKALSPTR